MATSLDNYTMVSFHKQCRIGILFQKPIRRAYKLGKYNKPGNLNGNLKQDSILNAIYWGKNIFYQLG